MKRYRIQIRHKGIYVEGVVASENDKDALNTFYKNYEAGLYLEQSENTNIRSKLFITIEETDNGTTEVNIGETSIGVQVGVTGVRTG
jgi:hypothetical protein|tara:strand:+ start:286 stop:546 length:261 start_codon:yes stop_codon:yes gene_type:complete